jgi:hypothetical protein
MGDRIGVKKEGEPDPHATNRGVRKEVSALIDWVSVTFKDTKSEMYPQELSKEKVECKPFNGYNLAVRYSDGRIELRHTMRPEMGTHVVYSGSTLRNLGVSPEAILSWCLKHGCTVTRLDVAIDCFNCGLKPQKATEEIEHDRCKTKARQFPLWNDAKMPGYTQYIGKKSSTAFCRIYDKAAEMGILGDYTRVECSFSGNRAQGAALACIRGEDYRGVVRGFVDFSDWSQWREIMSAVPVPTREIRSISNTKRWLLDAAATSLAREMFLDGEHDFYFRFIDAVQFHLQKLEAGEKSSLMNEDSQVA